jgi:hypothetical protein
MVVDQLRVVAVDVGIVVGADDAVSQSDAARLTSRSPKTLRNVRADGAPPAFRKLAGRARYSLTDLARWIMDDGEG